MPNPTSRVRSALTALLVVLLLSLSSCSALGGMVKTGGSSAAGALVGSLLGLPGTIVGAFLGGGFGGMWTENDSLRERLKSAEAAAETARHERDVLGLRVNDIDRRLSSMPLVPAADPNLPTLSYGPPPPSKEDVSWLRKTPFRWLMDRIGGKP
jgi:hypothetical protein